MIAIHDSIRVSIVLFARAVRSSGLLVLLLTMGVALPDEACAQYKLYFARCTDSPPTWRPFGITPESYGVRSSDKTGMESLARRLTQDSKSRGWNEHYAVGTKTRVPSTSPSGPCGGNGGGGGGGGGGPQTYTITKNIYSVGILYRGQWIWENHPCNNFAINRVNQLQRAGWTVQKVDWKYSWESDDTTRALTVVNGLIVYANGRSAGWTCSDGSN